MGQTGSSLSRMCVSQGTRFDPVDGVPIALCPFFVKGEERGRFEGKHGKRRHQRIREGNVSIVKARIREGGKAVSDQGKSASAERCWRALGATLAMGNPITRNHIVRVRGYFRIEVYERPVRMPQGSLGLEAQRELLQRC